MRVKQIIISGLILLLSGTGAQAAEMQRVTLHEAIAKGLERNNEARSARFQAESVRSGATAASLHYLPSVTVEEAWSRSDLPVSTFMMKLNQGRFTNQDFDAAKLNNPAPVSDFRTVVSVEQPILVPAAWAAHKAAQRGAERQEAISEQARQQIAFQIFQHYLEVQKAHAQLQASAKALDEARESRRQATVRTAAGLGLKSDELRAATQLAAMEQYHISAANNLTLARMRLALATGGQPGDELDVAEPVQLKRSEQELSGLISTAQRERRDLQASERGKEQADAALLQARSGFLPTVGAVGAWQMNDANSAFARDHDAWMVGVSLRWNIFDGFRTWHGSGQARASRAAAVEQLEQVRKEVSYQVHEAWLRRIEAEKRREVASAAVAAADEAARLLAKRFDNALATMVELLDAQSALNQARANLVESDANLMLATGRLYHSAGIFLKEVQ
ncbi:TolC family protein [Trichlorobacter lovleyi]|uniref:Outer membrane efflux protein n=1 Tax=Trichlorobacter lovleyi (strain ATCC BAA-1151 / DSM 17278 / SZ) TaxID=398767 RepID=B3E268_TRIL1|nr:TolC family protein [Trichlorobacter lovleyi]ACD97171.1 outer membrane efflux protein [Trichlorobacter lovleyi SZ]